MEWWVSLLVITGGLLILMIAGLPIALSFLAIDVVGAYLLWGGQAGLAQLITSTFGSVSDFSLVTVVLFILMGNVMFESGIGMGMIDAVDKWLGRTPGRLGLVAISAGTILASLTGSSMGSIAVLGPVLTPEMERRGYKKTMSLGPILAVSAVAKYIPPTSVGVICAILAKVSVGHFLLAIIIPGLLLSFVYATYTIGRCWLEPSLAPSYDVAPTPLSQKLALTARHILPIGLVVFLVTGIIFLGVATPSEAAATGTLGTFILAAAYGRLNWQLLKKSIKSTLETSVMVLLILATSAAFGQILAFSGASRGLAVAALELQVSPIVIIIIMEVVGLFLGTFMEIVPMLMILVPLYMPIVLALGLDPLWFAVLMLQNADIGARTPPTGMSMFVMKAVAPPNTTMTDIYKACIPYVLCDLVVMVLLIAFPILSLWLPGLMLR